MVRDLAAALLQIAAGLHPRFIVAPLGDHDEATKEARRKAKIQAKLRRRQERERREKLKVCCVLFMLERISAKEAGF